MAPPHGPDGARKLEASDVTSARQLEALLAALPDRTFLVSSQGIILEAHLPATLETFHTREELIGAHIDNLVPPLDAARARASLRSVSETGIPDQFEVTAPLGHTIAHFEIRMARAGQGDVLVVVRDVTEMRKTEASLRASEDRNRALLAAMPDRIVLVDKEGRILEQNIGNVPSSRSPDQVVGHLLSEMVPPEVFRRSMEAIHRVIRDHSTETIQFEMETRGMVRAFEATLTVCDGDKALSITREVTTRKLAEKELRDSEERFRRLLDSIPEIVFETDASFRNLGTFGGLLKTLQRTEADYLGKTIREMLPEHIAAQQEELHSRVLQGEVLVAEWSLPNERGDVRHYETELSPMREPDGRISGVVGVGRDITERRRNEEALLHQKELYETLLKAQSDMGEVVIVGEGGNFDTWERNPLYRNAALTALSGYTDEEIGTTPILNLLVPEERVLIAERLHMGSGVNSDHFEATLLRKDGKRVPIEIAWKRFKAGSRTGIIALIRDISERARAREQLERRAFFDSLTELPNRSLLQDRLRQALAAGRRTGNPVGLLLLDLDRFKEINDTFGHAAGDSLLQSVAARLMEEFRDTDTIARLGGDEFAFVLPDADLNEAQKAARRILKVLEQPMLVEGQPVEVGASIGIAIFPEHGVEPAVLLRRADVAMYAAKRQGTGYALYEQQIDRSSAARVSMTAELRQAIDEHQLILHYQPQLELQSRKIVGIEALVRWQHPRRGILPPSEFVPMAEETGLIRPLLTAVLEAALRQCEALRKRGWELVTAVNLSMRNLVDPQLPEIVEGMLAQTGVPPRLLELELTESAVMADAKRALEILSRLRAMGVRLTIDDFGTGHSSLAYLHRLPLDGMKIDKSFVTHVKEDESSAAIVRSTIDLAHNLHFQVVAEGVEDAQVLEHLARLGCDIAQGYFISPPLPGEVLPAWLAGHNKQPT